MTTTPEEIERLIARADDWLSSSEELSAESLVRDLTAALRARADAPAQKPEPLPCITPDVQRAADAAWERIGGRPTDGQKGEGEANNG